MIDKEMISAKFDIIERDMEFFHVLGQRSVLDKDLALRLEDMAGFRNLLVHRYGDIDNLRVLEIIKNDLDDVLTFEKEILQYLEKE